jgi:hypothetical protein
VVLQAAASFACSLALALVKILISHPVIMFSATNTQQVAGYLSVTKVAVYDGKLN